MAYQSKAELAAEADRLGITVDPDWTREELLDAIEAHEGADSDEADGEAADGDEAPAAAGSNLGWPHQPGEAPPGS